ncbi:hypothetical protein HHK36_010686 [Tetracentron sinense]|uniref:HTH myb-type domain-containing protein n=1 Tax=Tetracentron sinense TaxID=13715 RepID=A0A835DGJ6_TETSI|nr:hypothetical protein HHK36_010686 [Tetracentron sinense]
MPRYSDASWSGNRNWMSNPYMDDNTKTRMRAGFHGPVVEMLGGTSEKTKNGAFYMDNSTFTEQTIAREFQEEIRLLYGQESCRIQTRPSIIEPNFLTQLQERGKERARCLNSTVSIDTNLRMAGEGPNMSKRKAAVCNLDLNLSLNMSPRQPEAREGGWGKEEVDSNLSLSLLPPSKKKKYSIGFKDSSLQIKEMKDSGSSEGSKSSPSEKDEDEGEEVDDDSKPINGGSPSNSTIEEIERKADSGSVRQYARSKISRLRWTPDLHLCFVQAIERLGGQDRATPKLVLQLMDIKGLSIAHVKSHLQMYRSKKNDDPGQVTMEQGHLIEGRDRHIYNLSQLPMLQCFNQRPTSSFRYGDASWSGHENQMHNPYMTRASNDWTKPGFYGSVAERIFGSNNINSRYRGLFHMGNSISNGQADKRTHETQNEFQLFHNRKSWRTEIRPTPREPNVITQLQERGREQMNCFNNTVSQDMNCKMTPEERSTAKRKALDCDLNLSLSLKITPRHDEYQRDLEDDEVGSSLTLSLFSPSSSKLSRLKEGDDSRKHARRSSTLDLTI